MPGSEPDVQLSPGSKPDVQVVTNPAPDAAHGNDVDPNFGATAGMTGGLDGEPLRDCELTYESQQDNVCHVEHDCQNGHQETQCAYVAGRWSCECQTPAGKAGIQVAEPGTDNACKIAAEACAAIAEPNGTEQCQESFHDTGRDQCFLDLTCSTLLSENNEHSVGLVRLQYTWCEEAGEDEWRCECAAGDSTLGVTVDAPEDGSTICLEVHELCSELAVTVEGPFSCEPSYQSSQDEACEVQLECTAAAMTADSDVEFTDRAWAFCRANTEAPNDWQCTCDGSGVLLDFSVEEASSWASCERATEVCIAALEAR